MTTETNAPRSITEPTIHSEFNACMFRNDCMVLAAERDVYKAQADTRSEEIERLVNILKHVADYLSGATKYTPRLQRIRDAIARHEGKSS